MNVGNGLVEIGALTTLIGSNTAGDLAVGNKGSAGIVWGSITTFGNSSVIMACAGAALPGWLRHILALRTRASDEVVGMHLLLSGGMVGRFAQAVRIGSAGEPLGISSETDGLEYEVENEPRSGRVSRPRNVKYRDVFAFDRSTTTMLGGLTATSPGHPLEVHMFHSYDCYPHHNLAFQLTALGLSLLKVMEVYYLFLHGGRLLGLLSAIPFGFSFVVAVMVELHDVIASRKPMSVDGHVDLVVGSPPTVKQPGGPRKVVLGALKNPKTTIWWKAYYTINAVLQIISLLIYYQLFGQEQVQLVTTWASFQVLWVTLRAFVFHFTDLKVPAMHRKMSRYDVAELTPELRLRVLNLAGAVGIYQMYLHPRDVKNYKDDTFSAVHLSRFFAPPNIQETYELPLGYMAGSSLKIEVISVVGDTLLSGTMWMAGEAFSPMDLYDSCVIILSVSTPSSQTPRTISIPAARVFSVSPDTPSTDTEKRRPAFVPRGAGHSLLSGQRFDWIYWIPCSSGLWLNFHSERQSVLGRVEVKVLSDADVGRMLSAGTLNIGFKGVGDVKSVVDVSRTAVKCLRDFIQQG